MTTTALVDIQRLMARVVMNPLTPDQRTAETLADGTLTQKLSDDIIRPNDRLTSFQRLELYNRQYWFRLIDCLYDDFPGLRAVVGERRFYDLVIAYLSKYPSRSFALRNLSCHMSQFLLEEPHWAGRNTRSAVDMARFEWAQIQAFDGPAISPLSADALSGGDPASLYLQLQPYLSVLSLSYPFDEFLIAQRAEETTRSEAARNTQERRQRTARVALPKAQRTYLAVHRFQSDVFYKRLERPAFVLLSAINQGLPLGQACELAAKAFPPVDRKGGCIQAKFIEWFSAWSALQWFGIPAVPESETRTVHLNLNEESPR